MKTKKSNIVFLILLIIGLIAVILTFFPLKSDSESPEIQNKVEKDGNKEISDELEVIEIMAPLGNEITSFQGQIIPKETMAVRSKLAGTIRKNRKALKVGTSFKKGDILFELERVEILYTLLATRTSYKAEVKEALKRIQEEFPSEIEKWTNFEAQIHRTQLLPPFPKVSSDEELTLLMELDLLSAYRKVQKTEEKAENHFYLAPYDGFVVTSTIQTGQEIDSNTVVLTIAKQHSLIVSATINKNTAESLQDNDIFLFTNASNETIGTGKVLELKESNSKELVEVSFSLNSQRVNLVNEKINIVLPQERNTVLLPVSALVGDSIYVMKDNSYIKTAVEVIKRENESVEVVNNFGPCKILKNGKVSQ